MSYLEMTGYDLRGERKLIARKSQKREMHAGNPHAALISRSPLGLLGPCSYLVTLPFLSHSAPLFLLAYGWPRRAFAYSLAVC